MLAFDDEPRTVATMDPHPAPTTTARIDALQAMEVQALLELLHDRPVAIVTVRASLVPDDDGQQLGPEAPS